MKMTKVEKTNVKTIKNEVAEAISRYYPYTEKKSLPKAIRNLAVYELNKRVSNFRAETGITDNAIELLSDMNPKNKTVFEYFNITEETVAEFAEKKAAKEKAKLEAKKARRFTPNLELHYTNLVTEDLFTITYKKLSKLTPSQLIETHYYWAPSEDIDYDALKYVYKKNGLGFSSF